MQMQRYETLILVSPDITNDEANELEKAFDRKVQEYKGNIISYDRWGKYHLAYQVKHNDYGVYFLVRFEVPATKKEIAVKDVKSLLDLKFNTLVLRYMTSQLSNTASLEYKRPLSLDEKPRDMSLFSKEHRHHHDSMPRVEAMGSETAVSEKIAE